MKKVLSFLFLIVSSLFSNPRQIAVCMVVPSQGSTSAQSLIESGRRFFCVHHQITYFVFTDSQLQEAQDVIVVKNSEDLSKKIHILNDHVRRLEMFDYIFAIDPEMVFVSTIGDEVLSTLVGVQHPGFINKGQHYFSIDFFGGIKSEFISLIKGVKKQIDLDLSKNVSAHMQSYLNRYFVDHPPTRVLNPSYCYPENWKLDFPKKILLKRNI